MGTGTWGTTRQGTWHGVGKKVDRPAPAPLHPERHQEAVQSISIDDAPRAEGIPDFLVDTGEWRGDLIVGSATDHTDPGGHNGDGGGDHLAEIAPLPGHRDIQQAFAHLDRGGHTPAELKGAGGAANAGLRGDNARPESNPQGFRLGNDYRPQTMMRAVPTGRMRAALRAIGFVKPETGDTPSPPPVTKGRRINTSPFDPTAPRRGFGPEQTTGRHVARPGGDVPEEQRTETAQIIYLPEPEFML